MPSFGPAFLVLLVSCADAPGRAIGGNTMALSADGEHVWAASPYDDTVVRVDRTSGAVMEVDVGTEPSHMALWGDLVLVTLRGEASLAVVPDLDTPTPVRVVPVGAEPAGIVVDAAGSRVYVALSGEDQVAALDADTLDIVRYYDVEGQPTWLALHPSGSTLYVGSAIGGRLTAIDVASGNSQTVGFPGIENGSDVPFSVRVTGDLAVDDAGTRLAVPLLYVDNESSVLVSSYSANILHVGIGVVPVGPSGDPGSASTVVVAVPAHTNDFGRTQARLGSYVSAVAFDGSTVAATMEGSDVVVVVDVADVEGSSISAMDGAAFDDDQVALPAGAMWVHAGPRGIVPDGAGGFLVHDFLDRRIDAIDAADVETVLADFREEEGMPLYDELASTVGSFESATADPEVETGRRLFFSATDPRMSAAGSGISCATCHFQGRNDGLTWPITDAGSQTPSLTGGIGDTAPFTWQGTVATIADEALATATDRMRGSGLEEDDAAAIEAWVETIRGPDAPSDLDPAAVARGGELFAEIGCAGCHTPPAYTDGLLHEVSGLSLDTPSLRGVRLTAPYMHDGAAPTLRDVLLLAPLMGMGGAFSASSEDLDDLETFLRSL